MSHIQCSRSADLAVLVDALAVVGDVDCAGGDVEAAQELLAVLEALERLKAAAAAAQVRATVSFSRVFDRVEAARREKTAALAAASGADWAASRISDT